MSIEDYLGVEKPEEKEAMVQSPLSIFTEAFREWAEDVKQYAPTTDVLMFLPDESVDWLLHRAEEIILPYENALPKVISGEEYFLPIQLFLDNAHIPFAGLFYTALLNVGTEWRQIVIPNTIPNTIPSVWMMGYSMKKGVFENHGEACEELGAYAKGGCFINHGKTNLLSCEAKGGLFINYGTVNFMSPPPCKKSLFINYGHTGYLHCRCDGDAFVITTSSFFTDSSIDGFYRYPVHGTPRLTLTKWNLFLDWKLWKMVRALRNASEKKPEIEKMLELQKQITTHCVKHYGNR